MFLLDGSLNIGESEFEEMKSFVQAFIESVVIGMYLPFSSNTEICFVKQKNLLVGDKPASHWRFLSS